MRLLITNGNKIMFTNYKFFGSIGTVIKIFLFLLNLRYILIKD